MEQNYNPRTQGFVDNSQMSFASFKASKKSEGKMCMITNVKETINKDTGEVIPAHRAVCFFVARKNPDGTLVLGPNGGPIAERNTMEYVNFGPSVSSAITAQELSAQADALEVGQLLSGTRVLYKPNYNGIVGDIVE